MAQLTQPWFDLANALRDATEGPGQPPPRVPAPMSCHHQKRSYDLSSRGLRSHTCAVRSFRFTLRPPRGRDFGAVFDDGV